MGRVIKFDDDKQEVVLTLTGLTAFFALKRRIQMPYPLIKNVLVDYFDAPAWMIRLPGSSISFLNIYEGSYKYQNEWYFLSYSGQIPLVIIELKGHKKYRFVIFQCEDPTKTASEIRTHLRDID